MPNQQFFDRVCRATVTSKDGAVVLIDGFDVSFEIKKTQEYEPNKAKFAFYNLPDEMRDKLQLKDDSKITFEAGYKQGLVSTIFEGNLTHALSALQPPDWVTSIEAAEGLKVMRQAIASKSFGKGTPFKTVVDFVVKTFEGMKISPAITATIAKVGKTFPSGLTIDGPSARVLNDVLRGTGLVFSIQNGQVQINEVGGASEQPPVTLDYSSGLVNIPQLGEKKDKATINFQCFIRGEIVPWRKVQLLEPKSAAGLYVAQTVTMKGSNYDTEFYDFVEAYIA